MSRVVVLAMVLSVGALASPPLHDAQQLYRHSDYRGVLRVLLPLTQKDAPAWALIGQAHFMSADYKQATDAFEKATALEPRNSEYAHWLGKCWGRRAESSSIFNAPGYASKARQLFERSVMLDTSNKEALNDLFDYYLQAPGFLGGGLNRAEALVQRIAALDEAEGHYAMAQLLDKRKEFDAAEQQLRRAFELAPRQVGRTIDLAKYLSKLGRVQESEAAFAQAETLTPGNPRILYERARTYIRDNRNLAEARELLKKYLNSPLTPNDPPRSEAEQLLRKVGA
jgi:cytochrome c-type biogenesis protein CcmH/NrfG